ISPGSINFHGREIGYELYRGSLIARMCSPALLRAGGRRKEGPEDDIHISGSMALRECAL
ncbi:hypothetical protein NKI36_30740, partial [Mesorhizobium caraganae]